MKHFVLALLFSVGLWAQSPSIQVINLSSTSALRTWLPVGSPPVVEVWLLDPSGTTDAYKVTLSYIGVGAPSDGSIFFQSRTVTQVVASQGVNTVMGFWVDADRVIAVTAYPMKISGGAIMLGTETPR